MVSARLGQVGCDGRVGPVEQGLITAGAAGFVRAGHGFANQGQRLGAADSSQNRHEQNLESWSGVLVCRDDRICLLRFVGDAAADGGHARPASSRSPASLIAKSPLIMGPTSSGPATFPSAAMARRRTLASLLATSSSRAGTAETARR